MTKDDEALAFAQHNLDIITGDDCIKAGEALKVLAAALAAGEPAVGDAATEREVALAAEVCRAFPGTAIYRKDGAWKVVTGIEPAVGGADSSARKDGVRRRAGPNDLTRKCLDCRLPILLDEEIYVHVSGDTVHSSQPASASLICVERLMPAPLADAESLSPLDMSDPDEMSYAKPEWPHTCKTCGGRHERIAVLDERIALASAKERERIWDHYDPDCQDCIDGFKPEWDEAAGCWLHETREGEPHGYTCPRWGSTKRANDAKERVVRAALRVRAIQLKQAETDEPTQAQADAEYDLDEQLWAACDAYEHALGEGGSNVQR